MEPTITQQIINAAVPVVVTGILGLVYKSWNAFIQSQIDKHQQDKLTSEILTNLKIDEANQAKINDAALSAVKSVWEENRQNTKNPETENYNPTQLHNMAVNKAAALLENAGVKVEDNIAKQLQEKVKSFVPEVRAKLEGITPNTIVANVFETLKPIS